MSIYFKIKKMLIYHLTHYVLLVIQASLVGVILRYMLHCGHPEAEPRRKWTESLWHLHVANTASQGECGRERAHVNGIRFKI